MIKSIIISALFAASSVAFAYDVPTDAVIKVYDANGKQIGEMKRSEYKVVKLGTSKVKTVTKVVRETVTKNTCAQKNRVVFKAGAGPDGLTRDENAVGYEVGERMRSVLGVGYSRKVTDKLNLGVSVHSNSTTTLDVGVDF